MLAQSTKNSENMHHVRLNNNELYKQNEFPTYHVAKIQESLKHAPAMCHILEIEQMHLLGRFCHALLCVVVCDVLCVDCCEIKILAHEI